MQGTGYARMAANAAGSHLRLWRRVTTHPGAQSHTVRLWVRASGFLTGTVRVRKVAGSQSQEPTGAEIASEAFSGSPAATWKLIEVKVPSTGGFDLEISYTSFGAEAQVDVDGVDMNSQFKEQPPEKQPCIYGKPGLDEGCDL